MLTALIVILIAKIRRWQVLQQLKQQQILSNSGIGFHTKLVEVMVERFAIKGYKKFCILALIRVKGKVVYRKMHTILKADQSLETGDSVVIRYNPGKLHQVWVNNAA